MRPENDSPFSALSTGRRSADDRTRVGASLERGLDRTGNLLTDRNGERQRDGLMIASEAGAERTIMIEIASKRGFIGPDAAVGQERRLRRIALLSVTE